MIAEHVMHSGKLLRCDCGTTKWRKLRERQHYRDMIESIPRNVVCISMTIVELGSIGYSFLGQFYIHRESRSKEFQTSNMEFNCEQLVEIGNSIHLCC